MRVILTREEEDLKKDKEIFINEGFEVVELPLIRTVPLEFKLPLEDYDYIVFQSKRAVKYFLDREKIREGAKIVSVGGTTSEELRRYGYEPDYVPEEENVRGLIRLFRILRKGKVLIPRSSIGRKELINFLLEENFDVFPVDVYTVEPVLYDERTLKEKLKGDYILFYSPSAVESFFANLQKAGIKRDKLKLNYVAIGKTTKKALEKEGITNILVSPKPSTEEVVKLLKGMA
ncbi:uroporphyrinogen-III synthase [Aquifex pyrophilus]